MATDPRRLSFLLAVHRAGGVLAAADLLKVTPSAVSQQIARLEAEATRPPEARDPVAAYRDIAELLARRPVSRPVSPEDRTRT